MATSGSFNTIDYKKRYLTFLWSVKSQSIEDNTTTITWTIKGAGDETTSTYYTRNIKVTIDGVTVYNKPQSEGYIVLSNGTTVATGTYTFAHNSDGSRSFEAYAEAGIYEYAVNCTGSASFDLPQIARASTITLAADTVLGNACRVQWTPMSADFKYKLEFKMGNTVVPTEFIQPNTTALYTYTGFTIPLAAAGVIPEATKGTMTVTLYTYSASDEQIGEADIEEFTVTVPDNDSTKPTVSIDALTPVTALSSPFDTIFVQGKSKVKVSYTAKRKYSATIRSCSVSIGGKVSESNGAFTSDYLGEYGTIPVKVTAVDSRGFSNSATDTIEVIPYLKPRMIPVDGKSEVICARCDTNGNLTDTGTSLKVKVKRSYSKVESGGTQNNFCKLLFKWKLASAPDIAYSDPVELICTNDTYDGIIDSVVFDKAVSYTVQLIVTDDVGETSSMTFTILSEKVYWHRGEDFLALGMHSSAGGFEVAWPAKFYGSIQVGDVSLADYIRNIISEGG